MVAQGDYDRAIELAVKKLQKDKTADKNDTHIVLLEEAFKKASEEDTRRIAFLKKQNDPATSKEIYTLYRDLEYRQNLIRPLLPLYSASHRRDAFFDVKDYSNEIIAAKENYIHYLYDEGAIYMNRQTIADYRTAYHIYCELEELRSNYKDVSTLKDDAHFYGTEFIFVSINNRSGQIIPQRLEQELLDFNTYGLDNFWTEFHTQREANIEYTKGIALNFRSIEFSPERISEKEFQRTQRIIDGSTYKKDREGNILKDREGNPIKIDTYITVEARIKITEQNKAVRVIGEVIYRDLLRRRDIDSFPLSTEFIFENIFAIYRGDRRALSGNDLNWINNRFVPFPNNAQLLLDAGDDIKLRLKEIVKNHST
ncbi:hypothetical protein ULVI_08125 [Cochleicola gelatinilyticus]|uniref:Uncharacterized protein n=2 Tax=Cochleicola gelatinilyticus TaxID=1763537 RepID=A0A167HFG5_9FLAO|nr:hypothetical protein ULVI_08125 [Cochleicola gelatinilyticus]